MRSYARKHHVANAAVIAERTSRNTRYSPTVPQDVPGSTTSRAARTPQSIGFACAATRIQAGICARAISVVETNSSGSPMKFASAIIVASRRVRSAIPCESPEKALFTRIAARMTIDPTGRAGMHVHAERHRDDEDDHRLDRGRDRRADDLREDDREPARRRGEEALDHLVVEVVDHPHPAPGRAEEGVHDDDRRGEECDVRGRPEPPSRVALWNSWL